MSTENGQNPPRVREIFFNSFILLKETTSNLILISQEKPSYRMSSTDIQNLASASFGTTLSFFIRINIPSDPFAETESDDFGGKNTNYIRILL